MLECIHKVHALEVQTLILYVMVTRNLAMYEAGAQLVSLNTQSEDIFNMVMVGNFM
jgi:hypothetical protein